MHESKESQSSLCEGEKRELQKLQEAKNNYMEIEQTLNDDDDDTMRKQQSANFLRFMS